MSRSSHLAMLMLATLAGIGGVDAPAIAAEGVDNRITIAPPRPNVRFGATVPVPPAAPSAPRSDAEGPGHAVVDGHGLLANGIFGNTGITDGEEP